MRPAEDDLIPEDEPTWAPLTYTFAGIWEMQRIGSKKT